MRPTITGINISADSLSKGSISHNGNISFQEFSTNIIFTCIANGMPLPKIEWLFDGTVLLSDNRITVDSNNVSSGDGRGGFSVSTLTISTVQLSDRGMYTCRAVSGNVSPIPGQSAVTFELVVSGGLYLIKIKTCTQPVTQILIHILIYKVPLFKNTHILHIKMNLLYTLYSSILLIHS